MSDKNKIVVRAYKGIILAIISLICLVILTALVLLGGAFDFEAFEFSYEDLNIAYAFYIAAGAFFILIIAGIGLYSSSKNDPVWDDLITIDTSALMNDEHLQRFVDNYEMTFLEFGKNYFKSFLTSSASNNHEFFSPGS